MMSLLFRTLIAFASITPLVVGTQCLHAETVLTFDDLPNLPGVNQFAFLNASNSGSSLYGGIIWDSDFVIVGDEYVEAFHNQGGTNPFAVPKSGNYAAFNRSGRNGLTLQTTGILTGAWFSRPDMGTGPRGTTQVTVNAMSGNSVLGTETLTLVDTNPTFLDTSSFNALTGIDGYRIDRLLAGGDGYGGGHYILDDLQITAVPEPTATIGLALFGSLLLWKRSKGMLNLALPHG